MLMYDQIAMRTPDVQAQVELYEGLGNASWIRDTVDAVHLFTAKDTDLGDGFQVRLAFNYDIIPNVEFELLELMSGKTAQCMDYGRMSHFGYHLKRDQAEQGPDSLLEEIQRLKVLGFNPLQVSQTLLHTGTKRRYRYAFVSGRLVGGMPVKIIQRLLPVKLAETNASIAQGKELFACLA